MIEPLPSFGLAMEGEAPRPQKKKQKKKRTVRISFSCDEDMAAAILRLAKYCIRTRSNALASIIRTHLIKQPTGITFTAFPEEQSLDLWVWANQQAREEGGPNVHPAETLCVSDDGLRVLRLDYLTAA